jgi:ABC-type ATPase involved in cell division
MTVRSEVMFLAGRSGVGKSTVAFEIHAQLTVADVRHCLIEGDNLDLAYPPPWEHGLAERNLATMWANYRALDYHRLIYTNTVSVLDVASLTAAMGDGPKVTAVLLTANDETARRRLTQREIGSGLEAHLARSTKAAAELDERTPPEVHRIATDDRPIPDLATQIITLTGWESLH